MKYFVVILMALASLGLKAQTPSDILGQVVKSAGITAPTIVAMGQDPYNTLSRMMATSRIGLSANSDTSSFYVAVNVQGAQIAQQELWNTSILSGTSLTVTPAFSHIASSGVESEVLFTMMDPISGFPSVNPLTGGPITIEYAVNTGLGISQLPFASFGIGYRKFGHYMEGTYLPLGMVAGSILPSGIGLSDALMWRLTAGGAASLAPKLSVNYQASLHGMGMAISSDGDTIATIDEEGQVFTIENRMESISLNNQLLSANLGMSYDLTTNLTLEVGMVYYSSTMTIDQNGALRLYLQTNNPLDGSVVTAEDDLLDVLDSSISSGSLQPYASLQFHQRKHDWAITATQHTVSLLYIL